MSNSNLVVYTHLSRHSSKRTAAIDSIVIHHAASPGIKTIEALATNLDIWNRDASANYVVGSDGRVGLVVDESRRSHCTSNRHIDDRSITMEVLNNSAGPDWTISDEALETVIELCADICRRNKIPALNYTGDKSGNLHMHCWYFNTGCPGPYLKSKFSYIASEVNRRLGLAPKEEIQEEKPEATQEPAQVLAVGDIITLLPGTRYTTGKVVPDWVHKKPLYCRAIVGKNVTFSIHPTGSITGVTNISNVLRSGQNVQSPEKPEKGESSAEEIFAEGDAARLTADARYITGKAVPNWVIARRVYIRRVYANGNIDFSIFAFGGITGTTTAQCLVKE